MADVSELTGLLANSIYSPLLETDPAYIALQGRIGVYVDLSIKSLGYTVDTLPVELEYYVVLLTLKQLFRILAVSKAPEFNIESEFTKVSKSDRFKHYMELIKEIQREIELWESGGIRDTIKSAEVVISGRDGTVRNYNLSHSQVATLIVSGVTSKSAELTWTPFDLSRGRFSSYDILIGTKILYDDFADEPILYSNALEHKVLTDCKRNKTRFNALIPGTTYHVVVVYRGYNGSKDIFTASFTTLQEG